MLLHPLCDVGVGDQAAEQRGNLRSDVHFLLEEKRRRVSENQLGSILCQMRSNRKKSSKPNNQTNLKQSEVPVVKLILLACSITATEEWTVFCVIPMICESSETVTLVETHLDYLVHYCQKLQLIILQLLSFD